MRQKKRTEGLKMKFEWKKAAMAAMVCILSVMVAAGALAQGTYYQTTGSVHVRAGAGVRYRSLTTVKKGTEVEYLDQEKKDSRGVTWYKVKVNSKVTGWVSSKYVSDGADQTRMVEITGKSVNLRNKPSLKGEKVDILYKGDTALYLNNSEKDDRGVTWYQIRVNGGTCWVSSQYAKLTASGSRPSGESLVEVTGGKTYVRKNPSLKGRQLCVLSRGDTVEYLGKNSVDDRGVTWYSVRTSAGDGWISSKYTRLRGASSKPAGSETATTGSTVEVVGGSTNVRRYPSLDGKKLYVLSKGDTAEYLGKTSVDDRGVTWYAIRTSQGEGWISSKYAKLR